MLPLKQQQTSVEWKIKAVGITAGWLNITLPVIGSETTIHPNYSPVGGTSIQSSQNLFLANTSATYGNYRYIGIRKARYKFTMENLDVFAKIINFLGIPYQSTAQLGANYGTSLANRFNNKSIILKPKGETGATKTFVIEFEPWKIEGFKCFADYASSTFYWQQPAVRGSQYTNFYTQQCAIDFATLLTNGTDVYYEAEFDVMGIQQNVTLNT